MPPITFLPQPLKSCQGQDATYATTVAETYSLSHPITFMSSPHFHQKLHDPLSNVEFTFAVAGASAEEAKTTVVVFLPSAAGRWALIGMHGYAKERGLRLIAIDKPGVGGTPRCALQERHEIVASKLFFILAINQKVMPDLFLIKKCMELSSIHLIFEMLLSWLPHLV